MLHYDSRGKARDGLLTPRMPNSFLPPSLPRSGLRSDSDMYTLGFPFKPWSALQSIANGEDIYNYVRETAEEFSIDKRIRYNSEVHSAEWSSSERQWTLNIKDGQSGQSRKRTCKFVLFCSGYYDYQGGYQPHIPGMEDYQGKWIHPQAWPKEFDYTGKKIVVIGSGATAITLVPSLAKTAEHVTLLQRSPSYFVALPNTKSRNLLSYILPTTVFHALLRFALAVRSYVFYWACQAFPSISRYILRTLTKRLLPEHISIDPHFSPNYNPWDQRVCIVPDGDMFKTLREGKASIATGKIDTITKEGIRTTDGQELKADVIVCATGLNLKLFGGAQLIVDGEKVDTAKRFVFRGQMLTGVPNASLCFGYTNASWTLGSDVCVLYATRLMRKCQEQGISHVVPRAPQMTVEESEPLSTLQSGYFARAIDVLPRSAGQGTAWSLRSNWFKDILQARYGGLLSHMDVYYSEKKIKSA